MSKRHDACETTVARLWEIAQTTAEDLFFPLEQKEGKGNSAEAGGCQIGGSNRAKLLYLWMRAHGLKTKKGLWFLGLM